jgi:hypothetical protein
MFFQSAPALTHRTALSALAGELTSQVHPGRTLIDFGFPISLIALDVDTVVQPLGRGSNKTGP